MRRDKLYGGGQWWDDGRRELSKNLRGGPVLGGRKGELGNESQLRRVCFRKSAKVVEEWVEVDGGVD